MVQGTLFENLKASFYSRCDVEPPVGTIRALFSLEYEQRSGSLQLKTRFALFATKISLSQVVSRALHVVVACCNASGVELDPRELDFHGSETRR